MDELELRRHCYAQPDDSDPAFRRQLDNDPAAGRVARAVARFDQRLRFALNQTQAPEGLDGRIMLRIGMERRQRRQRRIGLFAVAASALLVLGLGLWSGPPGGSFNNLALNHVYAELGHLEHDGPVSPAQLDRLLADLGGERQGEIGTVRFAAFCPTPKGRGLHLVMDGDMGPVTVLYVPGATLASERQHFDDSRFVGVSLRAASRGSVAVIGEKGEAVEALADTLHENIRWSSTLASADIAT